MRLPAGELHELFRCHAARSFQQVQDLLGFTAAASGLGFVRFFLRFAGRLGSLGRPALLSHVATLRCGACVFVGFGWPAWAADFAVPVPS